MRVINDCARRVAQPSSGGAPARTEFTVLRRYEFLGEPFHLPEKFGGHSEVIGSKEPRVVRVGVEVSINGLNDRLARFRVRVFRKGVDRASPNDLVRFRCAMTSELSQPSGVRLAVVIGESKKFPSRVPGTEIPGAGRAGVFVAKKLERKGWSKWSDDLIQLIRAAVVHDDDLKPVVRIVEADEGLQTTR